MAISIDLQELKRHAEAAAETLAKLKRERDEHNKRVGELIDPINMLENVVAAWERLDPNRAHQQNLLEKIDALKTPAAPGKRPYGQVIKHIKQVLANGRAYSRDEINDEIIQRFNVTHREAAIHVALRRGVKAGTFAVNGKKYRLKEKST